MNTAQQEDSSRLPAFLEELELAFQYETTVEIPGYKGRVHRVVLGLLWDDEIREIQREIGHRVAPADMTSRVLETRFETLIGAIISIDQWKIASGDEQEDRKRQLQLRRVLGKSPMMVEFLYEEYRKLETMRDRDFKEALDSLKKSSRTPTPLDKIESELPTNTPSGSTPESSSSGEDGGT